MPRKKPPVTTKPCPRCSNKSGSVKKVDPFCRGKGCNLDDAGKGYIWIECPRCSGRGEVDK